MNIQESHSGITFAVHRVEKATVPLPTLKTHLAVKKLLGFEVESCCDYTSDCITSVDGVQFHPLLAATHFAFSQHRPLVLSPDMIWITIVQGVAQHVKNNGERMRHLFVGHQGKLKIEIDRSDMHKGSPENAWNEVIHDFSLAIREHLGETYDRLIADFSTTGAVEQAACEVALLDMFQPYFEYIMTCICGIPTITLEGKPDDWKRLLEKVEHLAPYDLDWWLPAVRSICDQFARAASGDIDRKHWQNIYKQEEDYGADLINGWIVTLIPYLKNGQTGNFSIRNPLLENPGGKVSTGSLPSGVSQVPFRCRWFGRVEQDAMEMLGGFLGVTQDPATLALRPKLGWAVRRGTEFDQLLARLSAHSPAMPLDAEDYDRCIERLTEGGSCELPGDFLLFYKKCDGVSLVDEGGESAYRFRELDAIERVEGLKTEPATEDPEGFRNSDCGPWVRFCDLADGSFLALELSHSSEKGWKIARGGTVEAETTGLNPIVACSFEEVLRRALNGERMDHSAIGS